MAENADNSTSSFFRKAHDFVSIYANNVQFQSSVMDLKLTLGQTNQDEHGNPIVDQRVAVTLPWQEAKILLYYIQVNIYFQEQANGRIRLPETLIPPDVPLSLQSDPKAAAAVEYIRALRDKLIEESK